MMIKLKKWTSIIICLALIFSAIGIGGGYAEAESLPYLESVIFSSSKRLTIGDDIAPIYEIRNIGGSNLSIYKDAIKFRDKSEPYLVNLNYGYAEDKIDTEIYKDRKMTGVNDTAISIALVHDWRKIEIGDYLYVKLEVAPESSAEPGKMDETLKQVYNFKVMKSVGLDPRKVLSFKDENGKIVGGIEPTPLIPVSMTSNGAYCSEYIIAAANEKLKVKFQANHSAATEFQIGDVKFGPNKETEIDLSSFPCENNIRTLTLKALHKEKGEAAGTEYTIKVYNRDFAPVIEPIQKKDITCEEGEKVELEVKATAPEGGEIFYRWAGTGNVAGERNSAKCLVDTRYAQKNGTYSCYVWTIKDGLRFGENSDTVKVTVEPTSNSGFYFYLQPKGGKFLLNADDKPRINVSPQPYDNGATFLHQWYVNDKPSNEGGEKIEGATKGAYSVPNNVLGAKYYYCEVSCSLKLKNGETETKTGVSEVAEIEIVEKEPEEEKDLDGFDGKGTSDNPYLIKEAEDWIKIRELVNSGNELYTRYIKMEKDMVIPDDWESIGCIKPGFNEKDIAGTEAGKCIYTFMGNIDGNNKKLTIPAGKGGLFNFARKASVKNLKIYGENITGSAILQRMIIDWGVNKEYPWTLNVDNVTLISGSKTGGAGLVAGTGSGKNTVTIRNCKVESGVTVGTAGKDGVGSLVGELNGYIISSTSAAKVIGDDKVGGLVGYKPNSMGEFFILNSSFTGKVEATGEGVGGLVGSGYIATSAPNTPLVSIENSFVSGDITGKNYVGGIFGGEIGSIQPWNYTPIRNNAYIGKVKATDGIAGGVIGYMGSLNDKNDISNNYYCTTDGKIDAIGKVREVDTSCAEHETASGANYINTAVKIPDTLSPGTQYRLYAGSGAFNRTDDPIGKDAEKLFKYVSESEMKDGTVTELLNSGEGSYQNWQNGTVSPELSNKPIAYQMSVKGEYKKSYFIGEEFDLTGAIIKAVFTDGSTRVINNSDVKVEGFDSKERGNKNVKLKYESASVELVIPVLKKIEPGAHADMTVYFTLLGDDEHEATEENCHTLRNGGLKTWIARTPVVIKDNDTVKDVFIKILKANNIEHKGSSNNIYKSYYISDVEIPGKKGTYLSEFSNGPHSGWMYTVNGKHPMVGVESYFLENNDEIVFHYTDDYRREEGSEKWYPELNGLSAEVSTSKDGKSEVTTVKTDVAKGTETGAGGESISTATVTVKEANATEMVKQAKENKSSEIVLDAKSAEADADKVKLELTKKVAENILSDTSSDLTLKLPETEVKINQSALKEIASQAKSEKLTIEVEKVKKPTDEQKKSAGESADVFALTVKSGETVIHNFGAGKVTVRKLIPEKLTKKKVAAIHIPEKGEIEVMSGKRVTVDKKSFYEFTTSHFSDFALVDADEVGIEVEEAMTADEVKSIVKDLKLKVKTKALKKSIRVTVKSDKETLMNLKDSGYTVKYKYYRAVKKNGKYRLISTKKSSGYTDKKVKRGKAYYYKARLAVYDGDGKLVATTSLKNCKASKRQLKKAA